MVCVNSTIPHIYHKYSLYNKLLTRNFIPQNNIMYVHFCVALDDSINITTKRKFSHDNNFFSLILKINLS